MLRTLLVIGVLYVTLPLWAQPLDVQGHRGCRGLYPENTLPAFMAALVSRPCSVRQMRRRLGFLPTIYSPYYRSLRPRTLTQYQALGVRVIPWTVNNAEDMKALIGHGVDGIITDYLDRLLGLLPQR